jgi:hypothetical protein
MTTTNNKFLFFHFMAFFLLGFTLKAQIPSEIAKKYPPYVIYRLYEVISKTNISVQKQSLIAEYFLKQDSLATKALTSGTDITEAMNYYTDNTEYLKTVLSPVELNDYKFSNSNSSSQLVKAVKYRNELNLDKAQIDALLQANQDLENAQRNFKPVLSENIFNTRQFEAERLIKILKNKQYDNFLELVVKPKARSENNDAWLLLKRYNLIPAVDSIKVYNQNFDYFLRTNISDARINNSKAPEKLDSVRRDYSAFKPASLLKVDLLFNKLPASQFTEVLRKRKELALGNIQIDSLISSISRLSQLRVNFKIVQPDQKYDATSFEVEHLSKILTQSQYNKKSQ